jgi:hypothetical protein
MAKGLTQTLTEMSTRNISCGKGGRYIQLTILPPSCAGCLEIWKPSLLEFSGPAQACNGIALPLPFLESGAKILGDVELCLTSGLL